MNALVTGGAGFIGSNLVDELLSRGHNVIVIDDFSNGKEENISDALLKYTSSARLFKRDIREDLRGIFAKGIDCVFHLAALARVQSSIEDPEHFNSVNVNGTLNLLEHCRKYNVKRFIFSSSSSIYGEPPLDVLNGGRGLSEYHDLPSPLSPYGLQKMIGEEYCKLYTKIYGIKTASLRYFNVYGDRQSIDGQYRLVMGIFASQMLNNDPLTIVGDGEQRRDFCGVKDVVEANILASEYLKGDVVSECFNIGNGINHSVNDIAHLFGGLSVRLPERIEPKCTLSDNTKAKALLKWKPTIKLEEWVPKWIENISHLSN
jgi:UDP-glucose 4-epimerase